MKSVLIQLARFAAAAAVLAYSGVTASATATFQISPSSGTLQLGVPFSLDVSVTGLDPTNPPYDYTFDLKWDPAVFLLTAVNPGTIYDCMPSCFFDPAIDNVGGTAAGTAGIDFFQTFSGTGGLLGDFVFLPIGVQSGTQITLQNTGLQSFDAALNLGGFDIPTDPAPTGMFDVVPEPASIGLVGSGLGLCLVGYAIARRKARGGTSRCAAKTSVEPRRRPGRWSWLRDLPPQALAIFLCFLMVTLPQCADAQSVQFQPAQLTVTSGATVQVNLSNPVDITLNATPQNVTVGPSPTLPPVSPLTINSLDANAVCPGTLPAGSIVLNCYLGPSKFESNLIATWLAIHGLPQTDSFLIYQYGRSDLRDQLRAFMFGEISGVIRKDPSNWTADETKVFQWIQEAVRQNQIAFYASAVGEYNRFARNPCLFAMDPTIAAKYGQSFNPFEYCYPGLSNIFSSPRVPAAEYFLEYGQKQTYDNSVTSQAGGAARMYSTQFNLDAKNSYIALGSALAGAAAGGGGILANIAAIVPRAAPKVLKEVAEISKVANPLQTDTTAAQTGSEPLEEAASAAPEDIAEGVAEGAAETTDEVLNFGLAASDAAGAAAIILIAIEIGVTAGLALADDLDNQRHIDQMLADAANAGNPPDLLKMVQDQKGYQKIFETFMAATLPESASTVSLPAADPVFRFLVTDSSSNQSAVNSFQYLVHKNGARPLTVQSHGNGWFLVTGTDPSGNPFSRFTTVLEFDNSTTNIHYFADRMANGTFVIRKDVGAIAPNDVDCEADNSGLTPPASVTTSCKSFVANSINVYATNNTAMNVQLPQPPKFIGPTGWSFTIGTARSFQPQVGTNLPGTTCSLSSTGGLPNGVTFTNNQFTGMPLAGSEGTYNPTVTANCGGATASQQFTLTVFDNLSIVWPTNGTQLQFIQGRDYKFTILTSGGDVSISATGALPQGMTLTNNGDGTATVSGTVLGPPSCSGCTTGFMATDIIMATATVNVAYTILPATLPNIPPIISATWFAGAHNEQSFNATDANVKVLFQASNVPSWATFANNGGATLADALDNTATLRGVPPITASEYTFTVPYTTMVSGNPGGSYQLQITVEPSAPVIGLDAPLLFQIGARLICPGAPTPCAAPTIRSSTPSGLTGLPGTFDIDPATLPTGLNLTPSPDGTSVLISGMPAISTAGNYHIPVSFTDQRGMTTARNIALTVAQAPDLSTIPDLVVLFLGIPANVHIPLKYGFPADPAYSVGDGLPAFNGTQVLPDPTVLFELNQNNIFSPLGPEGNFNLVGTPASMENHVLNLVAETQVITYRTDSTGKLRPVLGLIGPVAQKTIDVLVTWPGDANGDGQTDCSDFTLVKNSLNSARGQARYNEMADVNHDGAVNIKDLAFVQAYIKGTVCR